MFLRNTDILCNIWNTSTVFIMCSLLLCIVCIVCPSAVWRINVFTLSSITTNRSLLFAATNPSVKRANYAQTTVFFSRIYSSQRVFHRPESPVKKRSRICYKQLCYFIYLFGTFIDVFSLFLLTIS